MVQRVRIAGENRVAYGFVRRPDRRRIEQLADRRHRFPQRHVWPVGSPSQNKKILLSEQRNACFPVSSTLAILRLRRTLSYAFGWAEADAHALQERATVIRRIFQALPMIPAMKHAIAQWLNDDQRRTVRPPLERVEPLVAARLIEQLTAVCFTMPGRGNRPYRHSRGLGKLESNRRQGAKHHSLNREFPNGRSIRQAG